MIRETESMAMKNAIWTRQFVAFSSLTFSYISRWAYSIHHERKFKFNFLKSALVNSVDGFTFFSAKKKEVDSVLTLKKCFTFTDSNDANRGRWKTYRLPKASHAYDHLWQTEWTRIREVETERYLMDAHGMFYELSPLGWAGSTWGIRPISQHLRIVPDFTSYRGFLVLGGNQVIPLILVLILSSPTENIFLMDTNLILI